MLNILILIKNQNFKILIVYPFDGKYYSYHLHEITLIHCINDDGVHDVDVCFQALFKILLKRGLRVLMPYNYGVQPIRKYH